MFNLAGIKEKSDEMALCKINLAWCFHLVVIIPRLASNASEKNSSLHFFWLSLLFRLESICGHVSSQDLVLLSFNKEL